MIKELIVKNRSYRRFYGDSPISRDTLVQLVDLARLTASGANKQPLKYLLSCDKSTNDKVFATLGWAGYLTDWPGPVESERPTGYVVVLMDKKIQMAGGADHGIAAQSILLGAVEMGLGGCLIGSINKPQLQAAMNIPEQYEIMLVIALGKPKEEVIIEEIENGQDIKYWRDENQLHHVPKRKLKDIIIQ